MEVRPSPRGWRGACTIGTYDNKTGMTKIGVPQGSRQLKPLSHEARKGQTMGQTFMKTVLNAVLDPTRRSNESREFENALRRKIVGQEPAIEKVADIYQMFLAGLNPPGRPVGRSEEHT